MKRQFDPKEWEAKNCQRTFHSKLIIKLLIIGFFEVFNILGAVIIFFTLI